MSKHLVTLIYGKVVGKGTPDDSDPESTPSAAMRKAVLVAMADRANDDGSGVYVSKTRIAAELECSRTTVWAVQKQFEREGIIADVGKKAGRRGQTTIYQISVRNIRLLPNAWGDCSDLNTLDDGLGEDEEASPALAKSNGKASSGRTQSNGKAFNQPAHSVQDTDTSRPYRTKYKNPSEFKTAASRPKSPSDEAAYLLWEAQRVRASGDRERAEEMEERANAMMREHALAQQKTEH